MLFQFSELSSLLNVILTILLISGYLFIVITGAINLGREEKLKFPIFFIIIGSVEIIYEYMRWRIWPLVYMIMGSTILSSRIVHAIMYIIPSIISIITFGVMILLLGKKNKENFGKNLFLSGIFWIIYSAIILIYYIFGWGFFSVPFIIYIAFDIVVLIIIAFMIVSRIFLLLYAIRINERYLLASSIILLNASVVFIFYSIVNLIIVILP